MDKEQLEKVNKVLDSISQEIDDLREYLKGDFVLYCQNCYKDWESDKHLCDVNSTYAHAGKLYLRDGWAKNKEGKWERIK